MQFLVRFAQIHEDFRREELYAVAALTGTPLEITSYSKSSPFCIVSLPSVHDAAALISRSVLAWGIYELWGTGETYSSLHASVIETSSSQWSLYEDSSFKFSIDAYQGKRSASQQRELIDSFRYLGFKGKILMKDPNEHFAIFEEWNTCDEPKSPGSEPKMLYLGRHVASSMRWLVEAHDLKKRPYISNTSMDAELALVTANMALAGPGKIVYDPFVGSGSFLVAAASCGAHVIGSDIDGRSFRGQGGKGLEEGISRNMRKYDLETQLLDCFVGDLTNTPLRSPHGALLDAIVCDPPYGVREGLKVLGARDGRRQEIFINGVPAHTLSGYIAPKKPYSFPAMLDDILSFAWETLVEGGRLSFWMPTANEDEGENLHIPSHPGLRMISCCVQPFNKWSRRLLTYEKLLPIHLFDLKVKDRADLSGASADDLNAFRRKYFQASRVET